VLCEDDGKMYLTSIAMTKNWVFISVARGDSVSVEKDYELRMRDQEDSRCITKPTSPDTASDLRTYAPLDQTRQH
jgi:hypothetical protein